MHLSSNGDLNLNTSLDVDDDLLDNLGRSVKANSIVSTKTTLLIQSRSQKNHLLNQTLVDSHLKGVPGLGTLTVRSLAGGDSEVLGWETDWALDAEVLGLCALEQLAADLLEGLDLARGEGDADLVDLWGVGLAGLLWVLERHFGFGKRWWWWWWW